MNIDIIYSMKERQPSNEIEVKQKSMADLLSENMPMAQNLKTKEEVNDLVRKWVILNFLPERVKKEGEVDNEEDKERKRIIKKFDMEMEYESVYGNFKSRLVRLGLTGTLRNISLTEIKNVDQITDLQCLRRKDGKEKKVLIMSADYCLYNSDKGKVSKMFVFSLTKVNTKYIPKFDSSKYIELSDEVRKFLRVPNTTAWSASKDGFEGKRIKKSDIC